MRRFRRPGGTRAALAAATVLMTSLSLVGCGQIARGQNPFGGPAGGQPQGQASQSAPADAPSTPSTPTPPPDPFTLAANIDDGADGVKINKVLKVSASHGKLSAVKVTGKVEDHGETESVSVDGDLNEDKTGWQADELLEPTGEYTVKMTGVSAKTGDKQTVTSTFSTEKLSLDDQVYPSFDGTMSGTVGVGTPVVLRFDLPVTRKAEIEKHLKVSNTSGQSGSWHWYNDQEVHWRPKEYWKPGTKVTASADLNSLPTGDGRYGQMSTSTSFTVGDSVITKVDLQDHTATAYVNGEKARTMPISAGKPGWTTRSGTKLITEKRTDYTMTSEMIGLPKKGPKSYRLTAEYAMRITNSGEFLHSASWNSAYLGKKNASHGCVGMTVADSKWLYNHALPGSPVEVTGSDRELEPLNGLTDWNADFETYAEGSAL